MFLFLKISERQRNNATGGKIKLTRSLQNAERVQRTSHLAPAPWKRGNIYSKEHSSIFLFPCSSYLCRHRQIQNK